MSEPATADRPTVAAEVAGVNWYHTIELPGGVRTPGFYDTAATVKRVPLPKDLTGKRCLDIGTCDGFWAFELERRGAAEVVGVDVFDSAGRDWPDMNIPIEQKRSDQGRSQRTFEIARRALGSRVERVDLNVYDLSPEAIGQFDFVFIGTILLHLRDPIRALEAARSVVRGELMSFETVSPLLTALLPRTPAGMLNAEPRVLWWTPNYAAQKAIVTRAGFEILDAGAPVFLRYGEGLPPTAGPKQRLLRRVGAPCGWVRARPRF